MKTRSEVLRQLADSWQCSGDDYTAQVHRDLADLLDATTPRSWPPPPHVTSCLAWRPGRGWFAAERKPWMVVPQTHQPQFWLPMPPAPEVGP